MEFLLLPMAFVGLFGFMYKAIRKEGKRLEAMGLRPGNYLGNGPIPIDPPSLTQVGENIKARIERERDSGAPMLPQIKEKERKVRRMEWDQEYDRLQREALIARTGLTPLELAEYVTVLRGFFTALQKIEEAGKTTKGHVDDVDVTIMHSPMGEVLRKSYVNNCHCGSCVAADMTQRASQLSAKAERYEDLIITRANPDFRGISYFHRELKPNPVLDKEPAELVSSYDRTFKD